MPDAEEDPWSQLGLPVIVRRNDSVHETEQPRRVILHLHVDIKLDVVVLGLDERYELSSASQEVGESIANLH